MILYCHTLLGSIDLCTYIYIHIILYKHVHLTNWGVMKGGVCTATVTSPLTVYSSMEIPQYHTNQTQQWVHVHNSYVPQILRYPLSILTFHLLTVLWCCEVPSRSHSNISTNCRHSVVVHSQGVQSLPQYHTDSVPCCTSLSGLSRVWQFHVGWVSTVLDCTVIRASEPR